MKHTFTAAILAALCGTLHGMAQPTNASDTIHSQAQPRDMMFHHHERLGKLEKVGKILGTEIVDSSGHKFGKVEDLAIDLKNGRIVEVIVATGGILNMDERYSAVPPGMFAWDPEAKALTLNESKERFQHAPTFKMAAWESEVSGENVRMVYQYYNATPYFAPNESAHMKSAMTSQLGLVERASKIMGDTVRNPQNEKLGKIDDLIINLQSGRVVEVVVASGGFLGMGGELSAVPPQAFQPGVERDVLILNKTKEDLSQAPHFKSQEWPDLNSADAQAWAVYHAYNVAPYFSTNALDNTAQNIRDRQDNALTPLSQGNSDADVELSRKIRQQIMSVNGLSINARNVKVVTVNGRVTLRGPVANAEEKRQITDIANLLATPAQVDNQLQIEANPSNPSPVNQ